MATTTFLDGQTVIYASWLNDVNAAVYNGTFPNGSITVTNLTVTGTVSGAGYTTLVNGILLSPGPIGSGTPNTGAFTTLSATGAFSANSGAFTTPLPASSGGTGLASPGTSGNILTSNGSSWVSSPPVVVKGLGLGGETWNNVTSSRAFNTTYTNTHSYPIMVSASTNAMGGSQQLLGYVNGQLVCYWKWQFNGAGAVGGVSMIVPAGASYSCNTDGGVGVQNWVELY